MNSLQRLVSGELTTDLYNEFRRMCRTAIYARRLPPLPYSPTGQWEADAFDDLVDRWIVARHAQLVVWAHEPEWFWWQAERSLIRFVLNQRQRTPAVVVYRSLERALSSDRRFVECRHKVWGLVEWANAQVEMFDGNEGRLQRAAQALSTSAATTAKGRLRGTWVSDAAYQILHDLGAWVPVSSVAEMILHALGYTAHIESLDMDSPDATGADEPMSGVDVEAEVLATLAALEVVDEISPRQAEALLAAGDRPTISWVAKEIGVSRPVAKVDLDAALRTIQRHTPEGIPPEETLHHVMRLLQRRR